jgi:hypothetical protein
LEQVIDRPLLWVMDFNLRTSPGGTAATANVDLRPPYGDLITLKRLYDDRGALGLWKLEERAGAVQDASVHQHHGAISGSGVDRGQAGHTPTSNAYRFDGRGEAAITDDGTLSFDRSASFTVQCWFKTDAADNRVMLGKPHAYCVYVKNGKLAAWLMEESGQFKEALGTGRAADNRWHHVAAVYDRQNQRLSLCLDGKLDTADGLPGAQNPVDISTLGSFVPGAVVTIGGLGSGFRFIGSLDEVSIFRGALKPEDFAFAKDYPAPFGSSKVSYLPSGTYTSPPYDWTVPAKLTELTVAADLHGGQVTAVVETSNDGFASVLSSSEVRLRDGVGSYPLTGIKQAAQMIRVRLVLARGADAATSPAVDGFRISAEPEKRS